MSKVEDLDDMVPLYFKAFMPDEAIPGPISVYIKSDEEKRYTLFICEVGNYTGFFMTLCDKYQVIAQLNI